MSEKKTVRAKFACTTVKMNSLSPYSQPRYAPGSSEKTEVHIWPRTYEFQAMYDPNVPEDERYAQATPSGTLTISVDNPAVTFVPGRQYYLDFTPVEDDESA